MKSTNDGVVESPVIIAEHIDLDQIGSGGIDGMIVDFLDSYASRHDVRLVGVVSEHSDGVGRWQKRRAGQGQVDFLPIRFLDKSRDRRIPHSVSFAGSLLRRRNLLPRGRYQVHRIETAVILRLLGHEYSMFLHNDLSGLTGPYSDSFWKKVPLAYRWLERIAIGGAESVGVFSAGGAERIARNRGGVTALRSWYDPRIFFPSPAQRAQSGPLRVIWVGRLESQKDPLLAIDAFAILAASQPSHLTIVGAGSMLAESQARVRALGLGELVSFTGALPKSQVAGLMREADVFLLTSHYEGSPTVLVEAAASGLPSAATRDADTDGFLGDGLCGAIATSRDPSAVAEALDLASHLRVSRDAIVARTHDRTRDHGLDDFARVALASRDPGRRS